ncbi:MAG: hypothetical protein GY771_16825, partial [bacterium]|nr:hypothetical protein [bacterium]
DAILRSSARTIYIANVMTQPKRTDDYSLNDHIAELRKYGGFPIDYVLANNAPVSDDIMQRYSAKGAAPVVFDAADTDDINLVDFGDGEEVMVVEGSILTMRDISREEEIQTISSSLDRVKQKLVLRHDSKRLTEALVELLQVEG